MNLDREVFIEYFGIDNKNNIFNYEIYRKFDILFSILKATGGNDYADPAGCPLCTI